MATDINKGMAIQSAGLKELEFRLKKAGEALAEQKEFSESLIRHSAVATFVINAAHRVIHWNMACEELTGMRASDIIGTDNHWKPFYDARRPCIADIVINREFEDMPRYYTTYGKSPLVPEGLHAEGWYPGLGGKDRYIIFEAAPIYNTKGELIAAIETLQDITMQKRSEAELMRSQKLESIGILAGGIAHDFNNLLTAIIGNISIAKNAGLPDNIRDRLEKAEMASLRARYLTNQLLTFSKGGEPIRKTVSISGLLVDSATFVLCGSVSKCEFSIPADLWPVEIDEEQISRVVHNLVLNADQSMPEGGHISLSADNRRVGIDNCLPLMEGKYIKISVRDQGTGIPNSLIPKIFDPYFTTKQTGSGFGLATAYSIVKKHNGTITVESEVGAGSTFNVYLPASEKEAVMPEEAAQKPVAGKGKVLVVDDEAMVRDVAAEILHCIGHEVELAKDGAEAICMYKMSNVSGHRFDAVIMDLTIPGGMGGRETMARLLEIDPGVKAIVSSGYSNDPVMADFRKYGFSGVLAKPYQSKQLCEALREIMT